MAGEIEKLTKAVEDSEAALKGLLSTQAEEVRKYGRSTEETARKVSEFESKWVGAAEELRDATQDALDKAEKATEELTEAKARLTELEKRLGRSASNGNMQGGYDPEYKSVGRRFVEALTADEAKNILNHLRSGSNINFAVPMGRDVTRQAFETKATLLTTEATRFSLPYRDQNLMNINRRPVLRDFMQVVPVTQNSIEYLEFLGAGPETGIAVTGITQSAGVATVVTTAAHSLQRMDVVEISGADQAGYNIIARVLSVADSTHFTYAVDAGTVSPATGTVLYRPMSERGAAEEVAEAGTKPEARMHFTLKTAPIQTIAHWLPASRQVLDDVAQLQAMIDNELVGGVARREEKQGFYGTGISPLLQGIMTHADRQTLSQGSLTVLDAIRRAVTYVQQADMVPNLAVMHPNDWETVETAKSNADEHYLLVGGAAGSDQRVWRIPILVTKAIQPLDVLVGAFDQGATLYDREQTAVRISDQHSTYFVNNLIAVLAEERIGLAWKRPQAFCHLTLGA